MKFKKKPAKAGKEIKMKINGEHYKSLIGEVEGYYLFWQLAGDLYGYEGVVSESENKYERDGNYSLSWENRFMGLVEEKGGEYILHGLVKWRGGINFLEKQIDGRKWEKKYDHIPISTRVKIFSSSMKIVFFQWWKDDFGKRGESILHEEEIPLPLE